YSCIDPTPDIVVGPERISETGSPGSGAGARPGSAGPGSAGPGSELGFLQEESMVNHGERPEQMRPLLPTAAVALLLALAVLVSPAIGEWNLDPPEFEPVPVEIPEETPQEEPPTDLEEEDAEPEVEFESTPVSPIWGQIL